MLSSSLNIGLLCPHNPFDQRAFSGTAYHVARALRAHPDVNLTVLGAHRPMRPWSRWRAPRQIATAGVPSSLDAVVGLVATGLLDQLLGKTEVPLLHVSDATPQFLREFYGMTVPPETVQAETRVVQGVACAVYSSHYMADRARREFRSGAPDRLVTVPFGVNIHPMPERVQPKPPLDPLRLLYVGTNWVRKGGDLAVAALDRLRETGVQAELTVVGPSPLNLAPRSSLTVAGFLDKNRPADAAKLKRLFGEAHLFVLPTRADCTPMVVAEANSHGTPVLITETGGIGSLMAEGRNGRMLPPEADAAAWAAAIADLTRDWGSYTRLCTSSFDHARERLSWEVWARDIIRIVAGLGEGR